MQNYYKNRNQNLNEKTSWNKHQSKVLRQVQNQSLDYLTDPSFKETNRLVVLSECYSQNRTQRDSFKGRNEKTPTL